MELGLLEKQAAEDQMPFALHEKGGEFMNKTGAAKQPPRLKFGVICGFPPA